MSKKDKEINSIPKEMDWSWFRPIEVHVRGNFERASKIFKNLVQAERILSDYKRHQSYEKPSERARREHQEALNRVIEEEAKAKKIASGEYEKEKLKKLKKKEKKKQEKIERMKRLGLSENEE